MNQDQGFMYMMDENRVFYQNNEIPFDQLQYDRKLSEGGYGIVYRGRWKYTTVAIKEIKKEIIEQDKLGLAQSTTPQPYKKDLISY